jgi:hypothetical protein
VVASLPVRCRLGPDVEAEPHRRAERALLAVVQEAYIHGVSTRKVDELLKALGLDGMSKSSGLHGEGIDAQTGAGDRSRHAKHPLRRNGWGRL